MIDLSFPTPEVITVSELNKYVKSIVEHDSMLSRIYVRGEVSNLTFHRSGHVYFSLKDAGGVVRAVMFASYTHSLRFRLTEGMKVIAFGSVGVYEKGGQYQITVYGMDPDGLGALYLAYEQLRMRLEAEGLFAPEAKQPIPAFPNKVAVITSRTGAAVHDMINVISRRWPLTEICLFPANVQGQEAVPSLLAAIDTVEYERPCDVIIIGRGGGSMEDLWAFNDESLARRIFDCHIPIISAVGHESDYTICDFVADLRAPTPSAAAELAVRDMSEMQRLLASVSASMASSLIAILSLGERRLKHISESMPFRDPGKMFFEQSMTLDHLWSRLDAAASGMLREKSGTLTAIAGKLEAISPVATLSRGYSIVTDRTGRVISRTGQLSHGDSISIRLSDGSLDAEIK